MTESQEIKLRLLMMVPVYPEQVSKLEISRALGITSTKLIECLSQLPTDVPIGEDGALLCYLTKKQKEATIARAAAGWRNVSKLRRGGEE